MSIKLHFCVAVCDLSPSLSTYNMCCGSCMHVWSLYLFACHTPACLCIYFVPLPAFCLICLCVQEEEDIWRWWRVVVVVVCRAREETDSLLGTDRDRHWRQTRKGTLSMHACLIWKKADHCCDLLLREEGQRQAGRGWRWSLTHTPATCLPCTTCLSALPAPSLLSPPCHLIPLCQTLLHLLSLLPILCKKKNEKQAKRRKEREGKDLFLPSLLSLSCLSVLFNSIITYYASCDHEEEEEGKEGGWTGGEGKGPTTLFLSSTKLREDFCSFINYFMLSIM